MNSFDNSNSKNCIVLFETELNTLNYFSRQIELGLKELGYNVFWFNLNELMTEMGRLQKEIDAGKVLAMIGFNSNFFGFKTPSGISVWETLNVPTVNILVDHPFWYNKILLNTPANGIVLCIDRNHMNYISRFYPEISMTGFLPHGGAIAQGKIKRISERSIDVIYAGSLYKENLDMYKGSFKDLDFDGDLICKEAIDALISNPDNTIESVIETTLIRYGINMPDEKLRLFISSCVFIERIVSSYFREMIVSIVAKSGLNLTIYGSGWDKCDFVNLPNVNYKGMITPKEVIDKIGDSKILLNSMPWFKDGSHERIFNGILNGAVIATETNPYINETLKQDTFIDFSISKNSLKNLDSLGDRIKVLLDNESELQRMSDEAYQSVISNNTWQARAKELHNDLFTELK